MAIDSCTPPGLLGRRSECDRLSGLVAAVKAGRSQVLVVRGEKGIGKTALLDFLVDQSGGCRVDRAAGSESETELAFAGLHQLCSPHADRFDRLPEPQREALGTAFGVLPGLPPDRFLLGLSVLSLLRCVARDRPMIWVVDDAQWLDRASAETLGFVARRLAADEPVALVLAVREQESGAQFTGLPQLALGGLRDADAAALLESAVTGGIDPRVRNRILEESGGNPLALLELPRGLAAAELVFGGDSSTTATPAARQLEQEFLRQVRSLPDPSRRLLLTAAAEPTGDVSLLWTAARRLDIPPGAAAALASAGLLRLGDRVRFRHPEVRAAVYHCATGAERRQVHRALADATDADRDPDRRAWHRARATVGPDEDVAAELERSTGHALQHGGVAAAAAFLEGAAALTPEPVRRAQRSLDAVQVQVYAGALGDASALLATTGEGLLLESQRARVDMLRAQLRVAAGPAAEADAVPLLLDAARRLGPLDAPLARQAYLDAFAAVATTEPGTASGGKAVADAALRIGRPTLPGKEDVLLEGLAVLFTEGPAAAVPLVARAVRAFTTEELTPDEGLRSLRLVAAAASSLWDDLGWEAATRRYLDTAHRTGALGAIPAASDARAMVELFSGDLGTAASLLARARSVTDGTTSCPASIGELGLRALGGDAVTAEPFLSRRLGDLRARDEAVGPVQWARAVLLNSLGRYADALGPASEAAALPVPLAPSGWALAELIEAAVRSGQPRTAEAALEQLSTTAHAGGTDWALGLEASRRALFCDGTAAEALFREGIDRLGRTALRVDLARAQLLYGEWLRRQGRRIDARAQLRSAYEAMTAMGLAAFADRARRELSATGETVRRRSVETARELTAQEAHIARLAAQGFTNPEIGAALFISPRTVEWHLRKTFPKLGVSTRRELRGSLPALERAPGVR
jgi:DNA-binding CsgD family transcriptional regulator